MHVVMQLMKAMKKGVILVTEIALDMLADNEPIEKIVKYSHLPKEKVLELQKTAQ